MERTCLRNVFVLLLLVSFQRGRSQAPGDENEFCVNLNELNPPDYREPNREILFDSYNYPALVERVIDVANPAVHDAQPVFTRYSLEGTLNWQQQRRLGNCRVQVFNCKVASDGSTESNVEEDNWMFTQHVKVSSTVREPRVFLRFTLTRCPSDAGTTCRDSFALYIVPSNVSSSISLADVMTFSSTLSPVRITGVDSTPTSKYHTITRGSLTGYEGFRIALQNENACVTIHRIQVLYWTCPAGRQGLTYVETAGEPNNVGTFRCVGNSSLIDPAKNEGLCKVSTTGDEESADWVTLGGGAVSLSQACGCHPGFGSTRINEEDQCQECPPGMFKEEVANVPCSPCPESSFTNSTGSVSCQCDEGYYRGMNETASLPCAFPPSAPKNLTVVGTGSRRVTLSWNRPDSTGTRAPLFYTISFRAEEDTQWITGPPVSNSSPHIVNYTFSGLSPHVKYQVRVSADSSATDSIPGSLIGERSAMESFMTEEDVPGQGSPPMLNVPLFTTTIVVTLVEPDMPNGEVVQYNIRWYNVEEGVNNSQVVRVDGQAMQYSLEGLSPGRYMVQVQIVNALGVGEYSEPAEIEVVGVPAWFIIAIIGGVFGAGVLVAVTVVVICLIRICVRKRKERESRRLSVDTEGAALVSFGKNGVHLPEKKKKIYVDPRNYASTDAALRDFAKEIPPHEVRLEKVIGGGEFGDVCQGWWHKTNEMKPVKVAVKTLKSGSPNKARQDFLAEATIMGQFDDPNVIFLYGVVSKSEPVMIVMEYMSNGSLEHYLKKNDGLLNVHRLVKMAVGVASGMKYLAGIGFVHRDLAARNVLVDDKENCKISDFGLSRETEENVYNVKTGGKIPVRWTPPEAIHFRKFSEKSDVWSFGVLLWEVMSYGCQPYADWGNQQVLREVDKGYRLPCPEDCPDCVYYVMMKCWDKEHRIRPVFADVKDELEDLYKNDFVGRTKPARRREPVLGPLSYSSIPEWLEAIKMEQYIDNFVDGGLSLKECCELSQEDLPTLGITIIGHQNKIMTSINCESRRGSMANGTD